MAASVRVEASTPTPASACAPIAAKAVRKTQAMIDINELTLGQFKEIAAISTSASKPKRARIAPTGRAVVVVDRGWIFAGNMSLTEDGYLRLTNAIHVFKWSNVGFAKMLEEWRAASVDLRRVADVEVPLDSVVFRVPVASDWGLK